MQMIELTTWRNGQAAETVIVNADHITTITLGSSNTRIVLTNHAELYVTDSPEDIRQKIAMLDAPAEKPVVPIAPSETKPARPSQKK